MTENKTDKATELLAGAYAIRTVEDNIEYYRDFAGIYDSDFAERLGYIYPMMLAKVYAQHQRLTDNPVADIGCGTGLVADSLSNCQRDHYRKPRIDGIDISREMLDAARQKNLYRDLYQADLTQDLNHLPGDYGAIVSAGTFTFGHLGPEILPALLSLGRADTLFCIGVNSVHFEDQGFSRVLEDMVSSNMISAPIIEVSKIFDPKTPDASNHADDTATIIVYRQR